MRKAPVERTDIADARNLWEGEGSFHSLSGFPEGAGGLLDMVPAGLLIHNRQSILYANEEAARILGCDGMDLKRCHCFDFLSVKARETLMQPFDDLFRGGEVIRETGLKVKGRDKSSTVIRFVAGRAPRMEENLVQVILQDLSDITALEKDIAARKRAERHMKAQAALLQEKQADFEMAQQLGKIGSWNWDLAANRLTWSDQLFRILGQPMTQTLPTIDALLSSVHQDDLEMVEGRLAALKGEGRGFRLEYRIVRPDGKLRWVLEVAEAKCSPAGVIRRLRGTIQDITDRKDHEALVSRQALYDIQTNLPNRLMVHRKLTEICGKNHPASYQVHAVQVVVDDYKRVKDALGLEAGDELINIIAARLRSCIPDTFMLARLEGAEFLVLLEGCTEEVDVRACIHRIQAMFSIPVSLKQKMVSLTTSIGVASFPDDGDTADALMRYVDTATSVAASGPQKAKNSIILFRRTMADDVARRLEMEHQLWKGLQNDEFEVHFQPQFNLETEQLCGAEALIRWHSEKLGFVSPGEFIPVAEETGLILEIGKWVISQSCGFTRRGLDRNNGRFQVGINVSPVQFQDEGLTDFIATCVEEFHLPPECVDVEITEGVLIDPDLNAGNVLTRMKEIGLHLSLDDFGTGYSSISYLQKMKFDTLKIDRSFVQDICSDADTRVIVRSIVAMAKRLSMSVVAEGVETAEQFQLLQSFGCHKSQGFFHAKALPQAEFVKRFLSRRPE